MKLLLLLLATVRLILAGALNAQSTFLTNTVGAVNTVVEFALTLETAFPENGSVKVTLPNWNPQNQAPIHFISTTAPNCTDIYSSVDPISVTCVYSTSTRQLTLSNMKAAAAGQKITFRVNSFRSPFSSVPRTDIFAQTLSANGTALDSGPLVFQVSLPGTFDSVKMTTLNPELGALSSFKLSVNVNLPLDQACRLKVIAPDTTTFQKIYSVDSNQFLENKSNYVFDGLKTITIEGCQSFVTLDKAFADIWLQEIANMGAVMASPALRVELYAVKDSIEYVIAVDSQNAKVLPSDLKTGSIIDVTIKTPISTVQETTSVTVAFTIGHALPATSRIDVQFPTLDSKFGFNDKSSCALQAPLTNAIAKPFACQISNNKVSIRNIAGEGVSLPAGSRIQFTLPEMTNPISGVPSVGTFTVKSYLVTASAAFQIDSSSVDNLYSATPSSIQYGLKVSVDSYVTFNYPSTYTIQFDLKTMIPQNSLVELIIPTNQISLVDKEQMQTLVALGNGAFAEKPKNFTDSGSVIISNIFDRGQFDPAIEASPTVKIALTGLRNPISTRPTESFQIFLTDKVGNKIANTTTGLTALMRQGEQLNTVQITPTSVVNGQLTDYKIHVETKSPLASGVIFTITFPREISFAEDASCQPGNSLNNVVSQVFCKRSNKQLFATLIFSQNTIQGGTPFDFTVENVLNPGSTQPTSLYTGMFTKDGDDFVFSQYSNTPVRTRMMEPGLLKADRFDMTTKAANVTASYMLQVVLTNPVPAGGSFSVVYTSNVQFAKEASVCKVIRSGNEQEFPMTCTVQQNARKITMTGGLTETLTSGEKVKFVIGLFTNAIDLTDKSFEVTSYADADSQYLIDKLSSGLIVPNNCESPCATCANNVQSRGQCSSCFTDSPLSFLQGSQCLKTCADQNFAKNYVCSNCSSECSSCSGVAGNCTSCFQDKTNRLLYNNMCLAACPEGFFEDFNHICVPCEAPCKACSGSKNGQCLSCLQTDENPYKFLNTKNTCSVECEEGFFSKNHICETCNAECGTCIGLKEQCMSCVGSRFLLGTQCENQCPNGYMANPTSNKCDGCDPRCKVCEGVEIKDKICVECQLGFIVLNGTCINNCPDGYAEDPETKRFCIKVPFWYNLTCDKIANALNKLGSLYRIYFPALFSSLVIFSVVGAAWFYDKRTRVVPSMIFFLGPVEMLALLIQAVTSYKTEGIFPFECYVEDKLTTRQPILFIITVLVILLYYVFNLIMLSLVACSPKLRNDELFQNWRGKYLRWGLVTTLVVQTIFSFKCTTCLYSFFTGRKRFDIQFTKPKVFLKMSNTITILFMILGSAPIIVLNISSLIVKAWNTQLFISLIDLLYIEVVFIVLHVLDIIRSKRRIAEQSLERELDSIEDDGKGKAGVTGDEEMHTGVRFKYQDTDQKSILRKVDTPVKERWSLFGNKKNTVNPLPASTDGEYEQTLGLSRAPDSQRSLLKQDNALNLDLVACQKASETLDSQKLDALTSEFNAQEKKHKQFMKLAITLRENKALGKAVLDMFQGLTEEQNKYVNQVLSELGVLPSDRFFNEHDILGKVQFDGERVVVIQRENHFVDRAAQRVSKRGYLLGGNNSILNKKGDCVFKTQDMTEQSELPPQHSIERYNFSVLDVVGGKHDFNVNTKGLRVNPAGDVVDTNGRVLMRKELLQNNEFQPLLNYAGNKFTIYDVLGDFEQNEKGEFVKNSRGGEFFDKNGQRVNGRGYLIDGQGNILHKQNLSQIVFFEHQLNERGEFPKFFSFTCFDSATVTGNFERDPQGRPLLVCKHFAEAKLNHEATPNCQSACRRQFDFDGKLCSKTGYLVDKHGNVVDKFKRVVFPKRILVNQAQSIPRLFRSKYGLIRTSSDDKAKKITAEQSKWLDDDADSEKTTSVWSPRSRGPVSSVALVKASNPSDNQKYEDSHRSHSLSKSVTPSKAGPNDEAQNLFNTHENWTSRNALKETGSKIVHERTKSNEKSPYSQDLLAQVDKISPKKKVKTARNNYVGEKADLHKFSELQSNFRRVHSAKGNVSFGHKREASASPEAKDQDQKKPQANLEEKS